MKYWPYALWVNGYYNFVFYILLLMNSGIYRLVKINSVILKDTAFISSKSQFNRCRHCLVIITSKIQIEGWTDRLIDGQMAFQFYIVQDVTKNLNLKRR